MHTHLLLRRLSSRQSIGAVATHTSDITFQGAALEQTSQEISGGVLRRPATEDHRIMPSVRGEEPVGFFSLPLEIRDTIVSLKASVGTVFQTPVLIKFILFGQYDMLHQLQDEATFGIDGELTYRFALPRLHHISRRFRVECDKRIPARPLLAVFQKHEDFQISRWLDGRVQMEQVVCPRIVRLRRMQSQISVKNLHVNLHLHNTTTDAAGTLEILYLRLRLVKAFARRTCSLVADTHIRIRFMLDDVDDIQKVRSLSIFRPFIGLHADDCDCWVEIVVDCPSEQEGHEEEFARAKTLAVWRPDFSWWFDEQEIGRCQALAKVQSEWSTAATSPKSSEGEDVSEYQYFGEGEDISTTAEQGEHDEVPDQDPPAS